MPQVRLRTFDGSRDPEIYREWRREIDLIRTLYQLPPEQLGPLVYLSLEPGEGKPRGHLAHLDVNDIASAKGLGEVLSTLDAEYAPQAYEAAYESYKRYAGCRRRTGEEMMAYIARLRFAKRQLEAMDPGTRFSDTIFAQK